MTRLVSTALRYATIHAFGMCRKLVRNLIAVGADTEAPLTVALPFLGLQAGATILFSAIIISDVGMVRLLLKHAKDKTPVMGENRIGLLHAACYSDDRAENLKVVLDHYKETNEPYDVDVRDSTLWRNTPLLIAVANVSWEWR